MPHVEGILLVAKPSGPTSHDIVNKVRHVVPHTKVGHTGTLDPAASGLLVLCLGRLTRLTRVLSNLPKEYRGTILFGRETDTLDYTGRTIRRSPVPRDLFRRARELLPALTGVHMQTVPLYSAVKWKGKPFHRWVRAGQSPPARRRRVEVFEAAIWQEHHSFRRFEFKIVVSPGFYVRSWAMDFGEKLGVPAMLGRLMRTRIGPMSLDNALPATELSFEAVSRAMIRGSDSLHWIPSLTFGETALEHLRHGRMETLRPYASLISSGSFARVLDNNGTMVAVVRVEANRLKPVVLLLPNQERG